MYKTDKFIFIHLPKCAGTFIKKELKTHFIGNMGGAHSTIRLAHKTSDKKIIGSIRNPFDYYVSEWAYGCAKKGEPFSTFKKMSPDMFYVFNDVNNVDNFKTWFNHLHYKINMDSPGVGIIRKPNTGYKDKNIGFFTFRFFKLYNELKYKYLEHPKENVVADDYIRFENIQEDMKRIFSIDIQNNRKDNSSKHLPYQDYYDDELKRKTFELDKYLFTKFNYTF